MDILIRYARNIFLRSFFNSLFNFTCVMDSLKAIDKANTYVICETAITRIEDHVAYIDTMHEQVIIFLFMSSRLIVLSFYY